MTLGSRERVVKIAGAVLGFLLAVIGWFFVIAPQRGQTAAVNDSVAGAQLGNAGLQARINQLDAQNKLLPRVEAELSRARLALPQDSGLPAFLQSLQRIGNATAAQVTSLSVGQPTSLAPSTAPSPTSSEASTAAPASSTAPEAGAGGAWALPIDAEVTGAPSALNAFLDQLQSVQPRAVLISQVSRSVTGRQTGATLQLTMQAYVVPKASPAPATTTATPSAQAAAGS